MVHPLYPVASRLVGRHVIAHHVNGRAYPGYLTSVARHGIYMVPARYRVVNMDGLDEPTFREIDSCDSEEDFDLVYAPAAYFGFGALTGLTLGALAGGYYW
ncbi:hypothetical protein [Alicyclobacillus dauci]|uniref:Uncharacterized protein n=1 Tax=Alicyclobacillus dauci TaxID=1475485 RepID=A0ABY6Z9Q8_9BACL|nr:hypothetical protein [Alicyclobacillus dauci]WAH38825.1 hypothetical protein NZD86_10265 [Alicyclobacillus dauci]